MMPAQTILTACAALSLAAVTSAPAFASSTTADAYIIASAINGRCLTVATPEKSQGSAIVVKDCIALPTQQWVWNGSTLRNPLTNKCIDVSSSGSGVDNGSKIHAWNCHGKGNQQWKQDGALIRNKQNNKCIDIKGAKANNGDAVHLYQCHGKENQKWIFVPAPK